MYTARKLSFSENGRHKKKDLQKKIKVGLNPPIRFYCSLNL